eukprot:CAMPEP_0204209584 /NCGR_PEP_ID=MMETSP0361-20130328/73311_1 /ASSEMBLY_ACC=CAM_ASM_000343 /TAXON_ID=268821 /ORGANISM="Scrippsiella Hangoei, Strain SHTV-5" /LENGTH=42 /DNA_ID= /DNA_START= /DNA_END= /DNA_ORIENTATION=
MGSRSKISDAGVEKPREFLSLPILPIAPGSANDHWPLTTELV